MKRPSRHIQLCLQRFTIAIMLVTACSGAVPLWLHECCHVGCGSSNTAECAIDADSETEGCHASCSPSQASPYQRRVEYGPPHWLQSLPGASAAHPDCSLCYQLSQDEIADARSPQLISGHACEQATFAALLSEALVDFDHPARGPPASCGRCAA